jgi:hypothetical protein
MQYLVLGGLILLPWFSTAVGREEYFFVTSSV